MGRITVFFRFDDFSETSPVPVETGLVGALRKTGVCATFAVIPAVTEGAYHSPGDRGVLPLGATKIRFLRQAIEDGAIDVALHGWNHRSRSNTSPHSEFVGVSAPEQKELIESGRDLLRTAVGVAPRVFVPPWNRYDDGTLDALTAHDFTCVSANRYGPSRTGALRFLPTTADLREVRQAVEAARKSQDPAPVVGVLLHPYDFAESGDPRGDVTWSAFESDLRWLREQPDVEVLPISRLSEQDASLTAGRYRANQPLAFESLFPPFVRTTFATLFFRSEREARRVKAVRALLSGVTYGGAALVGWAAGQVSRPWLRAYVGGTGTTAIWLAIAAMLIALVTRGLIRREVYFRTAFSIALLGGMLLSLLL
jgi:peptidoglycan/xylan/chitin deacetylase (PgdA/CDA1 family)